MQFEPAAGIIAPVRDFDEFFPANFRMNIYRGCNHGCIYCDSRSECYRLDDFGRVRGKANSSEIIDRELSSKRKSGVVTTGSMTDPYNSFEAEYKLTRTALELLDRHSFGVGIITKSALVARDAYLLYRIAEHSPAYVTFSITCASDELSRRIEPSAPPTSARLAAMKTLSDAGVVCGVWLNPVLPYITDDEENITEIVRLCAANGVKYVICFYGMTLRAGSREYYYAALDRAFPGVKEQYIAQFGNAYEIASPRARELMRAFEGVCRECGLPTTFAGIRRSIYDAVRLEQMRLL